MKVKRTLLSDTVHECKSRSGLCPLDSTGGDGSTFDLILAVCFENNFEQLSRLESGEISSEQFKDQFVNDFMTLHHNIVAKYKRFNWND